MALGSQVVDLVGPHLEKDVQEGAGIPEVPVIEKQRQLLLVGILEEMLDAPAIEGGRTANNAMDFITLVEQQLCQI